MRDERSRARMLTGGGETARRVLEIDVSGDRMAPDVTFAALYGLYWATAASTAEALYLCAILNSPTFTELVRPFMSYGKDERHFDKHIWQLPIPLYDPTNSTLRLISQVIPSSWSEVVAGSDLSMVSVSAAVFGF